MMSTSENIHVKLQVENNFRRFFVSQKIKFSELKNKISTLLDLKTDFLVKYLDEENEWITITSDMELETGLTLYKDIFRILIELKEYSVTQSQFVPSPTVLQSSSSITPVESTVITPLYSSDNKVTMAMDPFASITKMSPPPYIEDNVNVVENSVNVSSSDVSHTPVDDNEIGTSAEKPWKKHRKNKERKEWKEEKKRNEEAEEEVEEAEEDEEEVEEEEEEKWKIKKNFLLIRLLILNMKECLLMKLRRC